MQADAPARRQSIGGTAAPAPRASSLSGINNAYAAYDRSPAPYGQPRDAGFAGGIPSSIIPAQASARTAQQPVAQAQQPAQPAVDTPATGHAASTTYTASAVATARKVEEADAGWTQEAPVTQSYNRNVPPVSQPRGTRHGNSFIPPKPVDPRQSTGADLFAGIEDAADTVAAPAAEKPVAKKSPSLFERFTLGRGKEDAVDAPRAETAARLTVEEGGKAQGEDDLDIPAFLRRQAN